MEEKNLEEIEKILNLSIKNLQEKGKVKDINDVLYNSQGIIEFSKYTKEEKEILWKKLKIIQEALN